MYIYNAKDNNYSLHILDPDYQYSLELDNTIYNYFKQIHKDDNARSIAGLYIEYEVTGILYEKHPYFYHNHAHQIQKLIIKYFDFGNANLLNNNSNFFFITMFNTGEEEIKQAFLKMYEEISTKQFIFEQRKYQFQIRGGLYLTHIHISPYHFFTLAKEQFENTFIRQNCLISTMSSLQDVFF